MPLSKQPPSPPPPPALPTVNVAASAASGNGASPSAVLEGARAQRSELGNQAERLQDQRNEQVGNLLRGDMPAAARVGLEARIATLDARIATVDQQLAKADQAVANAAAVPGAVVEPPRVIRNGPPESVFAIPIVFTIFVLAPIAIAYARRIWKRGSTIIAPVPQEVRDRLDRLGEAVESIAVEVERIGEGQRFVTKVMSESGRVLGAGAAQPIPVAQGERVGVRLEG